VDSSGSEYSAVANFVDKIIAVYAQRRTADTRQFAHFQFNNSLQSMLKDFVQVVFMDVRWI
jgi:hypothetical protein